MDVADPLRVAARVEERAHDLQVSVRRGPVQRIGVVPGLARVRIGAVVEQKPYSIQVPALGGLVQSGPALIVTMRVARPNERPFMRDRLAQRFDVASATCLEEALDVVRLPPLDFGLQRTPAGEAVVARDRQKSGCKPCARVSSPPEE